MRNLFLILGATLLVASSICRLLAQAPYQPAVPGAVTNYVNGYFAPVVQSGTFVLTSGSAVVSATNIATGDVISYAPVTTSTAGCFTAAIVSGTGFVAQSPASTGTFSYIVFLP
jgi:hypothetical protein